MFGGMGKARGRAEPIRQARTRGREVEKPQAFRCVERTGLTWRTTAHAVAESVRRTTSDEAAVAQPPDRRGCGLYCYLGEVPAGS